MPAPEPRTRASTSSSPAGVERQSSSHTIFSTEWVQASVIAPAMRGAIAEPASRQIID